MSYLKDRWVDEMSHAMVLADSSISLETARKFAEKQYQAHIKDHKVQIYNSYEEIVYHTTLVSVLDWIQSFKPLIAESGVFFYPKHMKRNLNIEIIKECMLDARTEHKREMFEAMERGDTFLTMVKDIQQGNDKVAANSGYGAEGERSSFLFNMHSAMSVTSCGRGQLSTAAQTVENILADNVKFFNMEEFYTWVNHIVNEKSEWKISTFDIIEKVPAKEQFVKRFLGKFLHHSMYDRKMIEQTYDSLDDEMRVRVYYKANLRMFLSDNFLPGYIYTKIMQTSVDFIDPNSIPEELAGYVQTFSSMVVEFVGYKYGVFRYEDRMKYQKRAVIPVSDTDS